MVLAKIKEILADQLGVDESEVTMEALVAEDLGADSLDVIDFLMSIEDEFAFEIPDEEIENVKTVGDIVNYIEAHKE